MNITVNGVAISEEEIAGELPAHIRAPDPRRSATEALILREILRQEARSKVTEAAVVQSEAVNTTSRDAALFIEETMIERLIEREVVKPHLDDSECLSYYEKHVDQFRQGDLIEASHILFEAKPGGVSLGLREQAEEVLQQVLRDPARFEELARAHSTCTSAALGGSLGQLSRGETVPEFEQVAFSLAAGEIAPKLVESRFGLHIIKVGRRVEGKVYPFEMIKEQLSAHLMEQKRTRALRKYLKGLVSKADIHGIHFVLT